LLNGIDSLHLVFEIVHKQEVIMLSQRIKESPLRIALLANTPARGTTLDARGYIMEDLVPQVA
jgi:hypothetical protein